jgi:hypothetical protein
MVVIACFVVPLLLYLPGFFLLRALPSTLQTADCIERHFERIVLSALINGWLAFTLAELGLFSIWLHSAILILLSALAMVVTHRRGEPTIPFPKLDKRQQWEAIAFIAVTLITFLLVIRPFEVILGVRDAGVYASTGFAIARTGGIVQHDQLLASIAQAAESDDPLLAGPAAQAMTNFMGVQNPERFIATRLRAVGFFVLEGEADQGRVVPQGLHLFPVWIGLLTSIGGPYVGLWATGLLGLLGALSVGMLGRRLGGFWVGILAFLLLALNSTQIWFSRYSTAETAMQFLLFAGFYFFAKMEMLRRSGDPDDQSRALVHAALAGVALGQIGMARIDFFIASGPAIPVSIYIAYIFFSHRWQRVHTFFTVAFGLTVLHALLHIFFISRAYFFDTGASRLRDFAITAYFAMPFLTETMQSVMRTTTSSPLKDPTRIWKELGLIAVALAGLIALYRYPQPLLWFEKQVYRWRISLLNLSAVAILLVASWAYFVRPNIIDSDMLTNQSGGWSDPLTLDPQVVQSYWVEGQRITPSEARQRFGVLLESDPASCETQLDLHGTEVLRAQMIENRGAWQGPLSAQTPNWLRLQGYVGAPISVAWCKRAVYAIPLANMVRVGWYMSPLGMVLAFAGIALWWRRMNAASWLVLLVGLLATFFYVRQTYGTGDQTYIYILRRFVPTVYPFLSLGMAFAIVAIGSIRIAPRFAKFVAASTALAMILFFVWTGRPIIRHTEYAGAVEQIAHFSERFDQNDILLMRGGGPGFERDVPDLIATPLHFGFGTEVLTVKSQYPDKYADALAEQVRQWRSIGREVYVALSSSGSDFVLPGFKLIPDGDFELRIKEFEQLRTQKPLNVQQLSLPFAIYRLEDQNAQALSTLPLEQNEFGPLDFGAQVRGFYRPETAPAADGTPFVWLTSNAIMRIAWIEGQEPNQVTLRVAGGERPQHIGAAQVCLSAFPEQTPSLPDQSQFIQIGCQTISNEFGDYSFDLDPALIGQSSTESLLLAIQSHPWVPAEQDPRLLDGRSVGIQFANLRLR